MSGEPGERRAFVLGLDGVPWRLLRRWTDDGQLPNLARIRTEGASGPLESTMPPTTAAAWPSIATGVGPDRHALYSFRRLTSDYGQMVNTSTDRRAPAVWDMHAPAVVANVPMTYPAQELDGELVAGMMAPTIDEAFTHPPSLAEELKRDIPEYKIGLRWSDYAGREDEFLEDLDSLLSARRALMHRLMERSTDDWRLFFFVYTEPDRLQHIIWDEDTILDHYRQLDEIVGEVLDYVSAHDATLYVVSDHGFGPVDRLVRVNRVLEEHGLLARHAGGGRNVLERAGITKSNLRGIANRFGLEERAIETLPAPVVDRIAGGVPGSHGLYDTDFSATQAFVYGSRCVYVNDADRFDDGIVEPAEVEGVKAAVRSAFDEVTDPETGETILSTYDGDDLFPNDPDSPDLVVYAADGYLANTALSGEVIGPEDRAGAHGRTGIFLAWGPHIGAGATPDGARLYDVVPTLLHDVGKPIPAPTDGRVLAELFAAGSPPDSRPIESHPYGETEETASVDADFTDVEQRLRGLGYIE